MQNPFLISDQQVKAILNWEMSLNAVRKVFAEQAAGRMYLTEPRVKKLRFPDSKGRYRLKGAAFKKYEIAGLRASRTVLLNEWPKMNFLGIVEERTAYARRVGAVTSVALEAFERGNFESLCLFGAGKLAHTTVEALNHQYEFEKITVLSRTTESRKKFAAKFKKRGLNIHAADAPKEAVSRADLIITMTNADEVLVKESWVDEDSIVVSMGGGQELDIDLLESAGSMWVDDLPGCLESGDLATAQRQGRFSKAWVDGNLAELGERGVDNLNGPIILIPRGMAAMDVMQAYMIASEKGCIK